MKLGQMQDGRFFRNVGFLEGGSQPKFYLGRDRAEALVRGGKIEQIWRFVVADFRLRTNRRIGSASLWTWRRRWPKDG